MLDEAGCQVEGSAVLFAPQGGARSEQRQVTLLFAHTNTSRGGVPGRPVGCKNRMLAVTAAAVGSECHYGEGVPSSSAHSG